MEDDVIINAWQLLADMKVAMPKNNNLWSVILLELIE